MPEGFKPFYDIVVGVIPAMAGGVVRYLHDISKGGDSFQMSVIIPQLIIAGVVGWWVIGLLGTLEYFEGRDALQGSVVGVSSFLAPNILDLLKDLFPEMAKKYLNSKIK